MLQFFYIRCLEEENMFVFIGCFRTNNGKIQVVPMTHTSILTALTAL